MMYLCGDKEIIDYTPLDMVIPSIEEEVGGRGRGRGRHEWFQERQMDRPNRIIGRGFSCGNEGNGIEVQQVQTGRNSAG